MRAHNEGGTQLIKIFLPNDLARGATGLELVKTLFSGNHIVMQKFTLANASGSLASADEINAELLHLIKETPLLVCYQQVCQQLIQYEVNNERSQGAQSSLVSNL